MKSTFNYIVENCGNFSKNVLAGMIAYGRESKSKDEDHEPNVNLPPSDGYATKEHDIQLGGFLHRECSREATQSGRHLSDMTVEEIQSVALKVSRRHIERHGECGLENYRHWMKRVTAQAKRRSVELPPRNHMESAYAYSRRIREWTKLRTEKWPEMQKAVGTHLVFSPDPKLWPDLRSRGLDERLFLKEVLTKTMKEFHDCRRDQLGPGHSLGWVAGTHVRLNGADRHPHIHVVVLKRDELGKSTDWSVSQLKGRSGKSREQDPMQKVKQLFQKHTEKTYERYMGKAPGKEQSHAREPSQEQTPSHRQLHSKAYAIATVARELFPGRTGTEIGSLIRLAQVYSHALSNKEHIRELTPTFTRFIERVRMRMKPQQGRSSPTNDFEPEP